MPDPVYVTEYDGRVVHVNAAACARLCYTRGELLHATAFDIAVGLIPGIMSAVGDVTRAGGSVVSRTHHRRRDGLCYPVECHLTEVVAGGRPLLMAVERTLGKPERRASPAASEVDTMLARGAAVVLDGGGRIRAWGGAAETVFGLNDAVGRLFTPFVTAPLEEAIDDCVRRAFDRRVSIADRILTTDLRRADGSRFAAEVCLTAMHQSGDPLIGLTVSELARRGRCSRASARPAAPAASLGLVGRSASMQRLRRVLETVAPTDATVLLVGETGTGKELCATALHELGPRRHGPFVKVNCAALPAGLIDSELFGHERGAFTGAAARRAGRFEAARGGTLFLDEIAELPLELQPRLLRVLEEKRLFRLGGVDPVDVDVRVVAASNRDLRAQLAAGRLREDLFFRLNVVPVELPPLRERLEDLPDLVRWFAAGAAERHGRRLEAIEEGALAELLAHSWPGNVRELASVVERAVIFARHGRLVFEPLDPV